MSQHHHHKDFQVDFRSGCCCSSSESVFRSLNATLCCKNAMPEPLSPQLSEPASLLVPKGRRARARKGYMDHQPFFLVGYQSKMLVNSFRAFTWILWPKVCWRFFYVSMFFRSQTPFFSKFILVPYRKIRLVFLKGVSKVFSSQAWNNGGANGRPHMRHVGHIRLPWSQRNNPPK